MIDYLKKYLKYKKKYLQLKGGAQHPSKAKRPSKEDSKHKLKQYIKTTLKDRRLKHRAAQKIIKKALFNKRRIQKIKIRNKLITQKLDRISVEKNEEDELIDTEPCCPSELEEHPEDVKINLSGGLIFSILCAHLLDYEHIYETKINFNTPLDIKTEFYEFYERISSDVSSYFENDFQIHRREPDKINEILDKLNMNIKTIRDLFENETQSLGDLDTKIYSNLNKEQINDLTIDSGNEQSFCLGRLKYGKSDKLMNNIIGEFLDIGASILNNNFLSRLIHSDLPDFKKLLWELVIIINNDLDDHKIEKRIRRFILLKYINEILNDLNIFENHYYTIIILFKYLYIKIHVPHYNTSIKNDGLLFNINDLIQLQTTKATELLKKTTDFHYNNWNTQIKEGQKKGVYSQIYNPIKHNWLDPNIQSALQNVKDRTELKTQINIMGLCIVHNNHLANLNKPYVCLMYNICKIIDKMNQIKDNYKIAGGSFTNKSFLSKENINSVIVLIAEILEQILNEDTIQLWKRSLYFIYTHIFWMWSYWSNIDTFNKIIEILNSCDAIPEDIAHQFKITKPTSWGDIIYKNIERLSNITYYFQHGGIHNDHSIRACSEEIYHGTKLSNAQYIDFLLQDDSNILPQITSWIGPPLMKEVEFDPFDIYDVDDIPNAGIKATLNFITIT